MGGGQSGDRPGISVARKIRGQIFVWTGIIGGALTIASQWSQFVKLAGWMHRFAEYWRLILNKFWFVIGFPFDVTIENDVALTLSLYVFLVLLSAGTIINTGLRKNIGENVVILVIGTTPIGIAIWAEMFIGESMLDVISFGALFVLSLVSTVVTLNIVLEGSMSAKIYTYSVTWFSLNTVLPPIVKTHPVIIENFTALMLLPAFVIGAVFVILPNRLFAKHVTFILIGVALIFGLSEVSKRAGYLRTAATSLEALH
jgi:hypothetical protein